MERRQYSERGDSPVGVCHVEGAKGREAKWHHRLEIRWVWFSLVALLWLTWARLGNGCIMEIARDRCSLGTYQNDDFTLCRVAELAVRAREMWRLR